MGNIDKLKEIIRLTRVPADEKAAGEALDAIRAALGAPKERKARGGHDRQEKGGRDRSAD